MLLSIKTTKPVIKITPTRMNKTKIIVNEPVLTNSKVPPIALGKPATIPAKIINDIPFPIPLSVICSPNHIKNIVPATKVETVVILNKIPGS